MKAQEPSALSSASSLPAECKAPPPPPESLTHASPGAVHPSKLPHNRRLRRRINNYFIYRAIRRAMNDCKVRGPVLMAPCGHGWFFDQFRADGIKVVGVDIEAEKVEFARMAVSPPMDVHQANILALPFADDQFDFVINNRFLPHFEEGFRLRAMKELARVTRRYLLVHYDTASAHQLVRRLRGMRKPDLRTDEMQGWRGHKRKNRRLLHDQTMMAAEGAAAGLVIRKLYRLSWLFSDRVYCLYEKAGVPASSQ